MDQDYVVADKGNRLPTLAARISLKLLIFAQDGPLDKDGWGYCLSPRNSLKRTKFWKMFHSGAWAWKSVTEPSPLTDPPLCQAQNCQTPVSFRRSFT
ncbi:hypothetical protein EXN66_Car013496 [Channa argus]|uniref:Uncharacterized protein n=1 Tax=Channa argus TaxID=215402 RepID=A0A6G1Q5J6_CHAAH|nr:hypothetical protein EXN66_Car013496 [Channa argus]